MALIPVLPAMMAVAMAADSPANRAGIVTYPVDRARVVAEVRQREAMLQLVARLPVQQPEHWDRADRAERMQVFSRVAAGEADIMEAAVAIAGAAAVEAALAAHLRQV